MQGKLDTFAQRIPNQVLIYPLCFDYPNVQTIQQDVCSAFREDSKGIIHRDDQGRAIAAVAVSKRYPRKADLEFFLAVSGYCQRQGTDRMSFAGTYSEAIRRLGLVVGHGGSIKQHRRYQYSVNTLHHTSLMLPDWSFQGRSKEQKTRERFLILESVLRRAGQTWEPSQEGEALLTQRFEMTVILDPIWAELVRQRSRFTQVTLESVQRLKTAAQTNLYLYLQARLSMRKGCFEKTERYWKPLYKLIYGHETKNGKYQIGTIIKLFESIQRRGLLCEYRLFQKTSNDQVLVFEADDHRKITLNESDESWYARKAKENDRYSRTDSDAVFEDL